MDIISYLNQCSSSFIQFSWTMLWQSSVLILILLLLDVLLRKKVKAVFRYGLWMLVLVKLALPVGLALPSSPAYWIAQRLPERKTTEDTGRRAAATKDRESRCPSLPAVSALPPEGGTTNSTKTTGRSGPISASIESTAAYSNQALAEESKDNGPFTVAGIVQENSRDNYRLFTACGCSQRILQRQPVLKTLR